MPATSPPSGVVAPSPVTGTRALIPSPIDDPLLCAGRTDASFMAVRFPVLTLPQCHHFGQA
ncbi:hypothetical protein GCM10027161_33650 [Microbispora hainanensis]